MTAAARIELLTEEEAAERLRVCCRTLRKARQSGDLSFHLIGRNVRYSESDLAKFIERSRVCPSTNAPDWIIVGGESGAKARPMELEWARSLRRQSAELGRVFNFKQLGGRTADKGGHELDGRTYFNRPQVSPA